ncbi:RUN and FYVE domain-containing protein 2 isoform X1 [Patella vulgata]|uniref:RUN and FYVE domain-containing protein 2 isoform X1 n=1 Tax=Patella vulgata TaxID=6465 RepID=UPI0024A90E5B|nr:RUN and FYVE domain-containing protein 2 isoform X1 [Patella vulgata]
MSLQEELANASKTEEWPSPVIAPKEPPKDEKPKPVIINPRYQKRDPKTIERCNLLNVCKLIIKELIDSSLAHGRMLDDDHVPLQQFFVVLEHVLRNGLKPKKGILRDKHEFWAVLEKIEKYAPEAGEITTSVRDMSDIKSPLGRARCWIRLALMQKKLADYFKLVIEHKDPLLSEFYEPGAFLMEEEGMVLAGLLVGLNVIDCNMCIKGEDLDQPMGVIDFSLYLKGNFNNSAEEDDNSHGNAKMATILDQKNYLEELNRHLNATVANLQQKLEQFQTTNALMKEDLAIAKNQILMLQEQNEALQSENNGLLLNHDKQIEATKQDIATERQTYETNRAGLDSMYSEVKQKLEEETQLRLDVEKELQLQISMKMEMEMASRLLEKDIHEKQDTVISLRKQIDDIKGINLELYQKLQTCEGSLKHKTEMVGRLEEKTNQLINTMTEMENRLKQFQSDKQAAEETARKLGQMLADKDAKRSALETDLKIEREWRATLQKTLEAEKEKCSQYHLELQQLKDVKKEYNQLKSQYQSIQEMCQDQERALAELGSQLGDSKMKVENMKESQLVVKEAQWMDDTESKHCKKCEKEFSISRRKHHCRNCGYIYCNECSDNKMSLPSSSKPVRVCDDCQTFLLQRFSAT